MKLDRFSSILGPVRHLPIRHALPEGEVLVWPGALDEITRAELAATIPVEFVGGPHRAPRLAGEILRLVLPHLAELPRLVWLEDVTYTTSPLGWHRDVPSADHKLAVYLDSLPNGGTIFDRARQLAPATPAGTVVLFDLGLEHRSADPAAPKRVIGLRARSAGQKGTP